jgi:hypothetical protein
MREKKFKTSKIIKFLNKLLEVISKQILFVPFPDSRNCKSTNKDFPFSTSRDQKPNLKNIFLDVETKFLRLKFPLF